MTKNDENSDQLTLIINRAVAEDNDYCLLLRLGREFEQAAKAYSSKDQNAKFICENYIGPQSRLILEARRSVVHTMGSIGRDLNRLQGKPIFPEKLRRERTDWFSTPLPTQAFLASEFRKRNLTPPVEYVAEVRKIIARIAEQLP